MATDARTIGEQIARAMGYTGAFGTGSSTWYSGLDATKQKQFNDAIAAAGGNRGAAGTADSLAKINTVLNPTPTPTQPPTPPPDPNDPYQSGGVVPVGFVEPLNEWQKTGLTDLAKPMTGGTNLYNLASTSLSSVPGMITAGTAPISGDALTSRIGEFMNPYTDQVINRTVGQLTDAASKARASLMASQGFRKAFGDTAGAVQQSELDRNYLNEVGDKTAALSYQGYSDATKNAVDTMTGEANRSLAGAQGMGGLSSLAGDLAGRLDTRQLNDILNKIKSGTVVQGQNQALLDVLRPEITGVQNYADTNLQQLAQFLNAFPSSTNQTSFSSEPNSASRIGSAITGLGSIDWGKVFG